METEKTHYEAATAESPSALSEPGRKPNRRSRFNWKTLLLLAATVILLGIIYAWATRSHSVAESTAPVTVAVAKVTREDVFNEVPIPAEFRPYVEVELHAKVTGYLDKMNVDFGDKVKSGQLLATIEVPELHDQLHAAVAVQEREAVDYTNANLLYTRLQSVNKQHPNLVAQQDLDTAQSKNFSAVAAIAAAKADVEKYQTMVKYTQITAPFDGVITRRDADPGELIQSGTGSDPQSKSLLRVSDNYRLRLDFDVSDMYVKDIHLGQSVEVRVEALDNKTFSGKITRFTDKVNLATRTMTTEIEVENPSLEIVPGMYAAVVLKVQERQNVLVIPTQAVGGQKDSTVYVVNDKHEIEARPVKLGLETPEKYEVTSGLKEGEVVMIGNRSLVHPGQKVDAKIIGQSSVQ